MKTASWVICNKLTGKSVFETFNENTATTINAGKEFIAIPILEYLQTFNASVRSITMSNPEHDIAFWHWMYNHDFQ